MAWSPLPEKVLLRLSTPQPHPFSLRAEKTALIVIGMQKRIYNDPGSRALGTIEGNARLLKMARQSGMKIIFIQAVRRPDSYEFSVFGREQYLLEGSPETEMIEELAPLPNEQVVKAYTNDPFARTGLSNLLLEMDILPADTAVIVTGVSASVEAYNACVGFACKHYVTLIPMDCQASNTVEEEARAFAKYRENSYAFTLSTMIEFRPDGMITREIVDTINATQK